MSAAVLTGPARPEAVAALANTMAAALRSGAVGGGEQRAQDHEFSPGQDDVIHLWQSSMAQVREHTESTRSQYAWRRQLLRELTGRARAG